MFSFEYFLGGSIRFKIETDHRGLYAGIQWSQRYSHATRNVWWCMCTRDKNLSRFEAAFGACVAIGGERVGQAIPQPTCRVYYGDGMLSNWSHKRLDVVKVHILMKIMRGINCTYIFVYKCIFIIFIYIFNTVCVGALYVLYIYTCI